MFTCALVPRQRGSLRSLEPQSTQRIFSYQRQMKKGNFLCALCVWFIVVKFFLLEAMWDIPLLLKNC